jgi:hypothetical protein
MTFEEMLAEAAHIAVLIGGTVITEIEPGDPIPIMYEHGGEDFVLELNVA